MLLPAQESQCAVQDDSYARQDPQVRFWSDRCGLTAKSKRLRDFVGQVGPVTSQVDDPEKQDADGRQFYEPLNRRYRPRAFGVQFIHRICSHLPGRQTRIGMIGRMTSQPESRCPIVYSAYPACSGSEIVPRRDVLAADPRNGCSRMGGAICCLWPPGRYSLAEKCFQLGLCVAEIVRQVLHCAANFEDEQALVFDLPELRYEARVVDEAVD